MVVDGPYGVGYPKTTPRIRLFRTARWPWCGGCPGLSLNWPPVGIMAVLAWQRAFVTLAIFAVWPTWTRLTLAGMNDYSPSLLLLVGPDRDRNATSLGAATLAVAAALKPYAFAWFLPAIGYAGLRGAAVMVVVTAVLWSPLFLWWGGVPSFLDTVRRAALCTRSPMPSTCRCCDGLRYLLRSSASLTRRWDDMVVLGSAAFVIFLFLDHWASDGYWIAVIPILGIALERRYASHARGEGAVQRRGDTRRARWATWLHGPSARPQEGT